MLRRSLAASDPETGLVVLAALATYWSIRGEHSRVLGFADAVEAAVAGWRPPDELIEQTGTALAVLLLNAQMMSRPSLPHCRALLHEVGPGVGRPSITAWLLLVEAVTDGFGGAHDRLQRLSEHPDRRVAATALQFLAHALENDGDAAAAVPVVARALELTHDEDGPWARASRQTMLAQMHAQLGQRDLAAHHARAAIPVLDRLDATDDAIQCRTIVAIDALARGDHARVEELLGAAEQVRRGRSDLRSRVSWELVGAELALARGERTAGLALYRAAIERTRRLTAPGLDDDPTGYAPWVLIGDALGVAVYAVHGAGTEGHQFWDELRAKAPEAFDPTRDHLDYPVLGTVLFALGLWGLRRDALPPADAVRLLVLADLFSYSRSAPTLAWENAAGPAERAAPGLIEELRSGYGERRGPALLDEARAAVTAVCRPSPDHILR